MVQCSDLCDKKLEWVEMKLTDIFQEAIANRPSLILMDDIHLIMEGSDANSQESSSNEVYSVSNIVVTFRISEVLVSLNYL